MHDDAPAGGTWEFTAVMVVIASWILYRYMAPQRWRGWARAGLIQAFIIALYAEMYGFPLTIYVLSGFLGLDIPWLHQSGHLWATLFGWGHTGAMLEMLFGYAIVFFGISLLIEGWREVYQATQAERLATTGLYGLVRHPQYTGIFLALFGQLIHWPTIPTVVLFPIVVWAYYRLANREENEMIENFGAAYRNYQDSIPMFFPHMANWKRFLGFQPMY
ncbi:MAG: isoprenylcysteine carboxylmethyltransferase family protein [Nitrospira sp.]|nr:isoprenylcysteine carboxylmethyltransferase family protein [Nitrospira sp.]MCA9500323.1 isoprenylcysteine carboxylmethyltransferase family protein [Nitrospira sp.]